MTIALKTDCPTAQLVAAYDRAVSRLALAGPIAVVADHALRDLCLLALASMSSQRPIDCYVIGGADLVVPAVLRFGGVPHDLSQSGRTASDAASRALPQVTGSTKLVTGARGRSVLSIRDTDEVVMAIGKMSDDEEARLLVNGFGRLLGAVLTKPFRD